MNEDYVEGGECEEDAHSLPGGGIKVYDEDEMTLDISAKKQTAQFVL